MLSIYSSIKRAIRDLLSLMLSFLIKFALAHPALKAWALTFVFRIPVLDDWLYRFAVSKGLVAANMPVMRSTDPIKLTPRAHLIYVDLKAAIEKRNMRAR